MRYWAVGLACVGGLLMAGTPVVKSVPDPGDVVPWEKHFRAVAGVYWIERAAQSRAECGWNQYARSPVGAEGPIQVMPTTWKWWVDMKWVDPRANAYTIPECLKGQNLHMLWLRRYWTDLDRRLGAYNAGQGSILKADRYAKEIGYEGNHGWLQVLVRVTGPQNQRETQGYIDHNLAFRTAIFNDLKKINKLP